jgi:hypothetical protein
MICHLGRQRHEGVPLFKSPCDREAFYLMSMSTRIGVVVTDIQKPLKGLF